MNTPFRKFCALLLCGLFVMFTTHVAAQAPVVQNPVLYFRFSEPHQVGGKNFIRYRFDVLNKEALPRELFAPAPALPPCGTNANASRTWVDVYTQNGKRLNGFCALGSPMT